MRLSKDIAAEILTLTKQSQEWLDGKKVKQGDSTTWDVKESDITEFHNREAKLRELHAEYQAAKALEDAEARNQKFLEDDRKVARPDFGAPTDQNQKDDRGKVLTLGEKFFALPEIKDGGIEALLNRKGVTIPHNVKTLFQTSAGWAVETMRSGRVELTPERRLLMRDLPNVVETGQTNGGKYMEETTLTQAAAERAEGGAYAESEYALTERSWTIKNIGHFIPVTDEQLADVAMVRDYLDSRLLRGVLQRLDTQLVSGNGAGNNLTGYLNVSGIQTQAKGADPELDAIHKAITKVEFTGFAIPESVIMHPNDYEAVRLVRSADGHYIMGDPSQGGMVSIWGLPVVKTPAMTENTALVGAFRAYSDLAIRQEVEIKISDSHSDYFTNGKVAIRAGMRCALIVYRPTGFCTVTGL